MIERTFVIGVHLQLDVFLEICHEVIARYADLAN